MSARRSAHAPHHCPPASSPVRVRLDPGAAPMTGLRLYAYQGNLMTQRFMIRTWPLLAKVACSVLLLGALDNLSAQTPQPTAPPAQTPAAAKPVPAVRTNLAKHVPRQAHRYYEGVWGVEALTVKYTESGEIIRFSYRVIDPEKAATLNDKKAEPSLIDPQAGVKLVVPQMGKDREIAPEQHAHRRQVLLDRFLEQRQAGETRRSRGRGDRALPCCGLGGGVKAGWWSRHSACQDFSCGDSRRKADFSRGKA